jgi:hypothetical protein
MVVAVTYCSIAIDICPGQIMKYAANLSSVPALVLGIVAVFGAGHAAAVQPEATRNPVQRVESPAPKDPALIDLMLFAHRADIAPLRVPAATSAAPERERR